MTCLITHFQRVFIWDSNIKWKGIPLKIKSTSSFLITLVTHTYRAFYVSSKIKYFNEPLISILFFDVMADTQGNVGIGTIISNLSNISSTYHHNNTFLLHARSKIIRRFSCNHKNKSALFITYIKQELLVGVLWQRNSWMIPGVSFKNRVLWADSA